jgi:hypothetical protein
MDKAWREDITYTQIMNDWSSGLIGFIQLLDSSVGRHGKTGN